MKFVLAIGAGLSFALPVAVAQIPSTGSGPAPSSSAGQAYPTKPIRLIVPFTPGSTTDTLARIVGQQLTKTWGQQVVLDNRAGAGGNIGADIVANAAADGYTLLIVSGSHAINPSLYSKLPFDTVKDFTPVTLVGSAPLVVVAHPSFPAASIRELIALAKARPRQFHYASGGNGTVSHLTMELFKSMAGVHLVHVPYKGGGPVLNAILSGEVQLTPLGILVGMPHVKAGKLKALAVTGSRRAPGVPGFAVSGWWGVLAPAGTSKTIVTRLHREIARLLQAPDVRDRLASDGIETAGNSPEEFDAYIRQQIATWAKVVKESGARID